MIYLDLTHLHVQVQVLRLRVRTFLPNPLSSIFNRLERERDVKRGQGPVNATDSLRAPLCVFLSFGRAFGSAVLPVPGTHVVALEPYKL